MASPFNDMPDKWWSHPKHERSVKKAKRCKDEIVGAELMRREHVKFWTFWFGAMILALFAAFTSFEALFRMLGPK